MARGLVVDLDVISSISSYLFNKYLHRLCNAKKKAKTRKHQVRKTDSMDLFSNYCNFKPYKCSHNINYWPFEHYCTQMSGISEVFCG